MTDINNLESTPDEAPNETMAEDKRKRGLGDVNDITYRMPWLLYFYPNPKDHPNYVLLNPKNDAVKLENKMKQILYFIAVCLVLMFLYTVWVSGALMPALKTMWFFFWRYITLIFFFAFFVVVIWLLKIIPYIIGKIIEYAGLTYNPLKSSMIKSLHKKKYNKLIDKLVKFLIIWTCRIVFFIIFMIFICILTFIIIPMLVIFGTLCGLVLGDLNTAFIPFGMANKV